MTPTVRATRSPTRPSFLQALSLAAGLTFASSSALAADYVQAPGSTLTFASSFEGEIFTGHFAGFTTTMRFDPQQLEQARLDVTIPLATATTANPERDQTLQGSDFFASKLFPQARFVATRFRHLGEDRYAADGTLSLRDAKQPVTLSFTWQDGATPVLTGRASVDRLAFGVGGGDWADVGMIPAKVAVSTRVNLTPAP
ncbi:polyisoprenoid-binding protein [Lysobacter ciconiae]|uniref:Polyisoprenoid-binding protein n=1 Tax=Novilysobacter ciconiae TaxID=2781022 RepID=A0A7S6UF19_9GAMM|nr:YceI family protein [Lysobacter ciconiae]QOW19044.1 polyisoprenoid-binding protein [Lysobacter ciconiae]